MFGVQVIWDIDSILEYGPVVGIGNQGSLTTGTHRRPFSTPHSFLDYSGRLLTLPAHTNKYRPDGRLLG